jgi:hypothetical protein
MWSGWSAVYFICYCNEDDSSSASDVNRYVISRELSGWTFKPTATGIFLHKVAYTRFNVPFFAA